MSEAGGSWFEFKLVNQKEIEFNKQFLKPNPPSSHPFGNYFFCDEHSGFGWKFKRLTWDEAEPLISNGFENNEIPKPPIYARILGSIFKKLDDKGSNS